MANDSLLNVLAGALDQALKPHYIQHKKERQRRRESISMPSYAPPPIRYYVFKYIKQAAERASSSFQYLYSVRQLYYQIRPLIQDSISSELKYEYFTPSLVTEYESRYGPLKGLIYEPRGHFIEPHKEVSIPLGTVEVSNYDIPEWEYDKVLFIEKEGFRQIFEASKLGERYDMAIMSTKGFSTRAGKQLLDKASNEGCTILVAHDCDMAGYEIANALAEETRTSCIALDTIDIGLNVADALAMDLQSETTRSRKAPSWNVYCSLDEQEKEFLAGGGYYQHYKGRRVELNAMTTEQLISWLEGRLKELGLQTKVLPPEDVVEKELEDTIESKLGDDVKEMVKKAIEELLGESIDDIEEEVKEEIGVPEGSGYYEELTQFLNGYPPEYWRDWVSDKATELEEGHIKDNKSLVSDFLKGRLKEGG